MKPENAKPNPKAHGVCDSTYTKYTGQAKPQKRDADGEAGGGAARRAPGPRAGVELAPGAPGTLGD